MRVRVCTRLDGAQSGKERREEGNFIGSMGARPGRWARRRHARGSSVVRSGARGEGRPRPRTAPPIIDRSRPTLRRTGAAPRWPPWRRACASGARRRAASPWNRWLRKCSCAASASTSPINGFRSAASFREQGRPRQYRRRVLHDAPVRVPRVPRPGRQRRRARIKNGRHDVRHPSPAAAAPVEQADLGPHVAGEEWRVQRVDHVVAPAVHRQRLVQVVGDGGGDQFIRWRRPMLNRVRAGSSL